MRKRLYFSFLLLLPFLTISSQVFSQVSGIVKESGTGKLISEADVFINNTTFGSVTNSRGEFALEGIAPGFAELVIYKPGYVIFKSALRIQPGKAYKLNLDLMPQAQKAKSEKIKIDEAYKQKQQWFERALLGNGEDASLCKIVNAKAVTLKGDTETVTADFSEPLIVDNNGLGYRVKCYIQNFTAGVQDVSMQGAFFFDSLQSKDDKTPILWNRNRLKAYWGSERHLFKSLVEGKTRENGFEIFNSAGVKMNPDTLVSSGKTMGYYRIKFAGKVKINYHKESESIGVQQSSNSGQVSWIEPIGSLEVSIDGIPFSSQAIRITGAMINDRLSSQLPLNYVPTASLEDEAMDWKNFGLLQEKVYLHTDRDYYYASENIWFKAYMGYSRPVLRDTLSKTLYVDLISPDKKIIKTKVYRINKGVAWGDFYLPDTLKAGEYYLRAYTNWMRNYGDELFFVKAIPVLDNYNNVEAKEIKTQSASSAVNLILKTNKNEFGRRERVDLSVQLKDEKGMPFNAASVSVSVTDYFASVPLPLQSNIVSKGVLQIDSVKEENKYFDEIKYFMERGLSFDGVVKDDKGVPVSCSLEIIQGNLENLISMETDEQGLFTVTGLHFYDSVNFSFKATRKKKIFTNVILNARQAPAFNYTQTPLSLTLRKDNATQRIQNSYNKQNDVTLLDEVEIKAKKIENKARSGNTKVYGNADYTIKGDRLTATSVGTNFLVSLQGKVPGLQVTETLGEDGFRKVVVKIRGGMSSMLGDTNPLILVDGVPFPDPNSLVALSPDMIDSVEVVTRAVPQFGSRGTNGVISIFTKQGASAQALAKKEHADFMVKGYITPKPFQSPDYSLKKTEEPDFRTTIYWNPNLKTDEKGLASAYFYTADVEGKYRIVLEGVTDKGIPFRNESFIEIK